MIHLDFFKLHKGATRVSIMMKGPDRSLTCGMKNKGGRNNRGIITLHGRGGGRKRKYRVVDFSRQTSTLVARISQVEYDPNRSAQIALLHYSDGSKKYVISPRGLEVGQQVCAGETAPVQIGNAMPLRSLPVGCFVHNVELVRGRGGQLARASGTSVKISGTDGNYVILKLPSKEKRLVHKECFASVGHVGTPASNKKTLGKAGRKRWLGRRPTVRGVAKNPVDHPHGGGEGRSPIGLTQPVSPWGKPALGTKTRKAAKSNRFIYRD